MDWTSDNEPYPGPELIADLIPTPIRPYGPSAHVRLNSNYSLSEGDIVKDQYNRYYRVTDIYPKETPIAGAVLKLKLIPEYIELDGRWIG